MQAKFPRLFVCQELGLNTFYFVLGIDKAMAVVKAKKGFR